MKDYFDFIIYLAFEALLNYEGKRSITLEQLHDYRLKVCQKHMESHQKYTEYDDKEFEEKLKYFHKLHLEMNASEELQMFQRFLKDNANLFSFVNGAIVLRDDINDEELEDAKCELDSYSSEHDRLICGELVSFYDIFECLGILGATKFQQFVSELIGDEKSLESLYQNYQGIELLKKTSEILPKINFRLGLIGNLKSRKMRCFTRLVWKNERADSDSKGCNKDLLSKHLMENDAFYNLYGVDYLLKSPFLKAIFDNGTLVYGKLKNNINGLWAYKNRDITPEFEPVDPDAFSEFLIQIEEERASFQDEFEEATEDIEDGYSEEELDEYEDYLYERRINKIFYLNFINHLNEYQMTVNNNDVLENAKRRVLYLLDDEGENLFLEEIFKKTLISISLDGINIKEDLSNFYMIARVFLIDILEGNIDEEITLRKMLYVSTYFDLTGDKRIKRIVSKYRKTAIGKKVSDFIFLHNYSLFSPKKSAHARELRKDFDIDSDNTDQIS